MSISVVVTVHCDGCGEWEHTDASGTVRESAKSRKRRGWTSIYDRSVMGCRRDYCPTCVRLGKTLRRQS